MRQFAVNPLQLALGGFCALTGTTMLVVPHLYRALVYESILPQIEFWGIAFLLGAVAMLGITMFAVRRSFVIAAYIYTGILLAFLAHGFFLVRSWTGSIIYLVFGVGLLLTPFLFTQPAPSTKPSGDLLSLFFGSSFAGMGLVFLLKPNFLATDLYGIASYYETHYGLAFVFAGSTLVYAQLYPPASDHIRKGIHLFAAAVSLAWIVPMFPFGYWTAQFVYVGIAVVVGLVPWLRSYLQNISGYSLRLRFALALSIIAALPLLLQATIATNHEEEVAIDHALTLMQEVAAVVARDVDDYIRLHQAAARALASHPDLLEMSSAEQRALLQAVHGAYPDVFAVSLYDAEGRPLARSDNAPLMGAERLWFFQTTRATNAPTIEHRWSRVIDQSVFILTAPIQDGDQNFAGVVAIGIESSRLSGLVDRIGSTSGHQIYIVSDRGQVVAHQNPEVQPFTDYSEEAPVVALLSGTAGTGAVEHGPINDEWLAGYARVPDLGWGVVVEHSAVTALAGVHAGREVALLILLLLGSSALIGGAVAVTWLTSPLRRLTSALNQFAAGDDSVPLPYSSIREVDQVTTAFGALRERLKLRTFERDSAEAELREQQEWYQTTLASIADGVIAADTEGRVGYLNPAAEMLTGWRQEEAQGQSSDSVLTLIHEQDRQSIDNPIMCALQQQKEITRVTNTLLLTKDGNEIPASISSAPIRNSNGRKLGAVAIFRDVSEHRRAEEELRQKNEIIETIHRVGLVLSAELDLHRLVQVLTDEATELAGAEFGAFFYNMLDERGEYYTLYTISGVPKESFSRFPMPRNTKLFGPTFHGQGVIRLDDVRKDPRYGKNPPYNGMPEGHLPVRSYLAVPVISRSGEVLGGLFFGHSKPGVFKERSERLLAGLAAQTAIALDNAHLYSEAQQGLRLREQFLAVASHELKTPLTTIKGYTDLLVRQASRKDDADNRLINRCQLINHEASKLNHLIDLLLDLSRIQGDRLHLDMEPVDIVSLAHRLVNTLRPTLTRHELELIGADDVLLVRGDQVRLEQIFRNLLSNAIKYSPDGGVVSMVVEKVPGKVRVSIHDQGVGIPEEDLPHLFDQFFRSQDNSSRGISGLGLGLFIVRHLVEAQRGQIQVKSEPGRGSTFVVELPLL